MTTLPHWLLDRVETMPEGEAFRHLDKGEWRSLTWAETAARVRKMTGGLRALGIKDETRVALLSSTRLEWVLTDLAILCAGGATTTIYPSTLADDCAYILKDSGSRVAFAEDQKQVDKLASIRQKVPALEKVIVIDGVSSADGWVMTLAELEKNGESLDEKAFADGIAAIPKSALATLIYTSGTTGQPKGVELTHDAWAYEGEAVAELGILSKDDLQYLWLPLAHAFGKVLAAAQLRIGFPTAIDGHVDKMVDNLAVVRPTFTAAVPRIFEKVHNRVVLMAEKGGAFQKTMFRWAVAIGREHSRRRRKKESMPFTLSIAYRLADALVLSKVRARFGGRLRYFISGSAALSREVAEFFDAAGLPILEGYGLTETSAASFVNRPEDVRYGTVGRALPGTEVKLAPEDGEILIRGRGVMRGYHNLPAATKDTLDGEWLRTGDIGELSDDGYLKITDRKKDLIKTSGGKYVAPQAIENQLKAGCPYISQVVVHGNNRNFVTALVTLDEDAMKGWAREHGHEGKSAAQLSALPEVHALIQGYVNALNKHLAGHESVKKFAVLAADFTLEAGELTPSLKLKRKAIEEKHRALLDSFYGEAIKKL